MANSPQDQASKPALSNPSASGSAAPCSNGSGPASRRILLAIRLRTQDSSGSPAGVSWVADEPAAALVMDLISASGGVPDEPWGAVLAARFADLQSALLTVRRLQWALEGLNESAASAATAASVVLDSLEDPAVAAATVRMLEHMAAGEVLVGAALADALQPLPGVTLRATDNGNWRELLWHGAEASQGFADDEQSVLSLIRKLGREDPGRLQIDLPRPTAETTPAAPEAALSERLGRSSLEPEPAPGFGRWLIVGGAAAVVVLIAALVIGGMVFGKHGKTAPPPPDISHKPAAPAPPPVAVPVVEKTRESRPPAKPAKQPRSEPKTEPRPESRSESRPAAAPSPRTPAVPCDLTETDIPRTLSRAESYMYAGKLTEAQAIFQRLLPCSSAHDKAQEGLDRVRQRIAAQSP